MRDDNARKKYMAKIQKLMRLANNTSSPEEAASAIAKAQAFMREHGISDTEVTFSEISSSSSKGAPSDAKKMPLYMSHLAATIEKAFAVKCVFSWRISSSWTPKRVVSFYGQDGRDVVAAYAFDVLSRQLRAARKSFQDTHLRRYVRKNKAALADKFCEGWASGAYHAVSALVISEEQSQQMQAYSEKMKSDGVAEAKTREAKKCNGHQQAAWLGYSEGKNARIHHGVSTTHKDPEAICFSPGGDHG
ncbi:DUF2786 domain-containing protein [Pantoea coffeiphila]|uniref:Uncharacterized protein n=1 Tax=Pantoea coffeiphila TaxID=1465635 RepID=A0A2S9I490_9GAMM|nr:DUF2786 domain-containing protein [Pantoea coffeiphila]PRD12616.1 hypothetical protein CQW29_25625 [Pantoea coffeiphila]